MQIKNIEINVKRYAILILQESLRVIYFIKMTQKSIFRQMELKRALQATKEAGCEPQSISISIDGSINITLATEMQLPANNINPWEAAVG